MNSETRPNDLPASACIVVDKTKDVRNRAGGQAERIK
jgi:hypothetical protein